TLLAIWRAGAIAVPLSPLHAAPELAHAVGDAAPAALVASTPLAARLADLPAAGARPTLAAEQLSAPSSAGAPAPVLPGAAADATVFMAVPTVYAKLLQAHEAAPRETRVRWAAAARALRLCTSGSAPLPAAMLEAFRVATGQTILERYGMTEIGMALSNPYD